MNKPTLWYTDNGAVYCTDHLGMTARYTGRDISGQRIERVKAKDAETHSIKCETCEVRG